MTAVRFSPPSHFSPQKIAHFQFIISLYPESCIIKAVQEYAAEGNWKLDTLQSTSSFCSCLALFLLLQLELLFTTWKDILIILLSVTFNLFLASHWLYLSIHIFNLPTSVVNSFLLLFAFNLLPKSYIIPLM